MAKAQYDAEVRERAKADGRSLAMIHVDSRTDPTDNFGQALFQMPVTKDELRQIVKFVTGLLETRKQAGAAKLSKA